MVLGCFKGREKIPAFNLGAYYNPRMLLAIFKYETLKNKNQNDEVGCVESLVFQSEFTLRDKDHVINLGKLKKSRTFWII